MLRETTAKPRVRRECAECIRLDAMAGAALRVGLPGGGWYRDESALTDVAVLRRQHAPVCKVPRGGAE